MSYKLGCNLSSKRLKRVYFITELYQRLNGYECLYQLKAVQLCCLSPWLYSPCGYKASVYTFSLSKLKEYKTHFKAFLH